MLYLKMSLNNQLKNGNENIKKNDPCCFPFRNNINERYVGTRSIFKVKGTNNYFSTICPYVSAGPDATCCDNDLFVTQGGFGGEEGLTIWTTSGDGSFNNVYNLMHFIRPEMLMRR